MKPLLTVALEVAVLVLLLWPKLKPLWTPAEEPAWLGALVGLLVGALVVDVARRLLNAAHRRRYGLAPGAHDNLTYGVNNISRFLIGTGVVLFGFSLLGIGPRELLTSLSIVAAAIAIVTRDYLGDFIAGLYFSFTKDFGINDYVKIGDHKGRVREIKMLKLALLNEDDDLVVLPNSKVYAHEIVNYTKRDIRYLSVDFQIDVNAITSIEHLEAELRRTLDEFDEYVEPGSFSLKIVSLRKDALDLKLQYELKRFDVELQRQIRRRTTRKIFNQLSVGRDRECPQPDPLPTAN